MPKTLFNYQDILWLLSKLREGKADYPADWLEVRKDAFQKQIVSIKISKENPSGGSKQFGSTGIHLTNHFTR